jgi:hypothetical protein
MRTQFWRIAVVLSAVIILGGCRGHESITGGYGDRVVVGEVTMAAGMTNNSPAGVRVGVGGTGMSAVLGTDGRFTFVGVPENAELHFSRTADGIDARMAVPASYGTLSLELSANSVRSGRRRAAPSAPLMQFEGIVKSISATEIVVTSSHKEDVTLTIDDHTVIRKGNQTLQATDLKAGDRVHVKAKVTDDSKLALEIKLQNPADDDNGGETMTANGTVKEVLADQLTVTTQPKGDVVVKVDSSTTIKKQGDHITLADIHVGDEVNTMGTKIDDHTLQARQIEVRGVSGH